MTTFKDRIKADITEAMRAREEAKLSTLRMLLSAIQNAEVAGDEAIVLTDDQAIKVLQSEAKKRAEAAQIYADAGRADAAAKERAELVVIEAYLPAAMAMTKLQQSWPMKLQKQPPPGKPVAKQWAPW